jgi:hypothetical protein
VSELVPKDLIEANFVGGRVSGNYKLVRSVNSTLKGAFLDNVWVGKLAIGQNTTRSFELCANL